MPGLVGIITALPRTFAEHQLMVMLSAMQHKSSYVCGTWADETQGIYVGWIARSGAFDDTMPLCNQGGNVVLAYSGEDFSLPGLRDQSVDRGHNLGVLPRPSYLVQLYEDDPTFPACLNGRFHGLLVDRHRRTSLLFNDRYGLHRLYYHQTKDAFYFAAEAKAILAACPELRRVSPNSMGEFVSFKCVLENRTFFNGLKILPPASTWIFRNRVLENKAAYFHPIEWENQSTLGMEDYYKELREVFSRNLSRYFSRDQALAVSLTGGLDTRMIMAWQNSPPGSLPCYSFGSIYRDCQDVIMGRRVAAACGQPYSVITVGDDFLSRFSDYAERTVFLSDGCADVSRTADLYVNELAAQIAPIRMTGNYGGEVLRRVRAFKPIHWTERFFHPDLLEHVQSAEQTYSKNIQCHPLSFSVFRQAPWHHYGLLTLEQTQLTVRTPYLDNELVQTIFRAPQSSLANNDISTRLISDGNPDLLRIRTDRGLLAPRNALSIPLRHWLEFTFKSEYAYDYGMPHWMARIDRVLSPFHPERLFLGRHKFYHYRIWYRDQLSNYVRDMLLDDRTLARPYLDRKQVQRLVANHIKGTENHTNAIHVMLTLEILHRRFIDSQIDVAPLDLPQVALMPST